MKFTSRTFGTEIEFLAGTASATEVAQALNTAGIACHDETSHYNHDRRPYWKIVTDASCGLELVSPVLSGEAGLVEIETVCSVLNSLRIKVSERCGLHVHVGANDLAKKEVAAVVSAYARYEKFFDSIVPPSRRNNHYCQSLSNLLTHADAKRFKNEPFQGYNRIIGTRYCKVNLEAYVKHGTIEFRQHSGTVEAEKIVNWIVLLIGFVEEYRTHNTTLEPVQNWFANFCFRLGLSKKDSDTRIANCAEWVSARFHKFNPSATVRTIL